MKKILLCLCALTILVAAVSSCEDTPRDSPKGSDTETTALSSSSAGGSEEPEKTAAESTPATPNQSTDSPESTTDRSPIELPIIPDK